MVSLASSPNVHESNFHLIFWENKKLRMNSMKLSLDERIPCAWVIEYVHLWFSIIRLEITKETWLCQAFEINTSSCDQRMPKNILNHTIFDDFSLVVHYDNSLHAIWNIIAIIPWKHLPDIPSTLYSLYHLKYLINHFSWPSIWQRQMYNFV